MKPAYFRNSSGNHDRWMVSYLDVLTILLILFVAMAAKSLHSEPIPVASAPPPAPVSAPAAIVPAAPPPPAIQTALEQLHLDVQVDPRGIVVSLPQELLFPAGEDRINEAALPTVASIAEVLRTISNRVILVGHADAVPIHNYRFHSNWDLAAARSLRLLDLLTTQYEIEESRLSVESHGSYDPKSTNETPDGRATNRRVEIVILN
jgi:flagellar motor protein MotB